ncbi:hypothetical protein ACWM35_13475 [Neobacillus sp. K501]
MRDILKLPFFNMFVKKRKRSGTMWASLIGLGLSAAVFGMTRGRRKDIALPFQQNMNSRNGMTNLALAEFSEELLASALKNDKNRK